MPRSGQPFLFALSSREIQALQTIADSARQAAPDGWVRWRCGPVHLGYLHPERADWLCHVLAKTQQRDGELHWDAHACSAEVRSAQLQAALEVARLLGLLWGWRNERFSFWADQITLPLPDTPNYFSVERSGFRFLGMMSHAVHINGFTPQGHVWCGRRAMSKATDPGMLDNLTAGGLPSGESALDCALRELEEEAGLTLRPQALEFAGTIRTARVEPQGYHDELLQVFNITLPDGCVPANQDGEVSEFVCLSPSEVMARIARGEFTADAAATLARGLAAK